MVARLTTLAVSVAALLLVALMWNAQSGGATGNIITAPDTGALSAKARRWCWMAAATR